MASYYSRNRDAILEHYKQNRLDKLAYQKEYTTRRKAAGWVPKKYVRKSRAKPKPEVKVFLVKVEDEPEPPEPKAQRSRPSAAQKQKQQPLVWKEASFSMRLD
jgi:hypothetical protein